MGVKANVPKDKNGMSFTKLIYVTRLILIDRKEIKSWGGLLNQVVVYSPLNSPVKSFVPTVKVSKGRDRYPFLKYVKVSGDVIR